MNFCRWWEGCSGEGIVAAVKAKKGGSGPRYDDGSYVDEGFERELYR